MTATMTTTTYAGVIVGFTRTDRRPGGYYPAMDGYAYGAPQDEVRLPAFTLDRRVELDELAELVFVVTNHPEPASLARGCAGDLFRQLQAAGVRFPRSLSVGDTVTAGDQRVACAPAGWVEALCAP